MLLIWSPIADATAAGLRSLTRGKAAMAPGQSGGEPTEFLPKLLALCLVVFDERAGHLVEFDVPEGTFTTEIAAEGGASLFSLAEDYMLPKAGFSDRLVTVAFKQHKILGFPVSISDEQRYERSLFNFNVCFLFDRDADLAAYEPVVRKVGRTLRDLELAEAFLSSPATRGRMHSILEQVYEDLSSYSEASIHLSGATMLDLRLFPSFANPAQVRDWDVAVLLVDLESMKDRSWDLTLYRMLPLINGVRSVRRIAEEADVEISLAREAFQHLLYYNCILLIDLFQFSNCYVLANGPSNLAVTCGDRDNAGQTVDMGPECAAYAASGSIIRVYTLLCCGKAGADDQSHTAESLKLLDLYSKLRLGLTVDDWMEENKVHDLGVDVRRLITFGVIKGFLRRAHCYPVWLDRPAFISDPHGGAATAPMTTTDEVTPRAKRGARFPAGLPRLLDGTRHSDELCLRYRCSFAQLLAHLRAIGTQRLDLVDWGPKGLGRVQLVYL